MRFSTEIEAGARVQSAGLSGGARRGGATSRPPPMGVAIERAAVERAAVEGVAVESVAVERVAQPAAAILWFSHAFPLFR